MFQLLCPQICAQDICLVPHLFCDGVCVICALCFSLSTDWNESGVDSTTPAFCCGPSLRGGGAQMAAPGYRSLGRQMAAPCSYLLLDESKTSSGPSPPLRLTGRGASTQIPCFCSPLGRGFRRPRSLGLLAAIWWPTGSRAQGPAHPCHTIFWCICIYVLFFILY